MTTYEKLSADPALTVSVKAMLRENADAVEAVLDTLYRCGGPCDAQLDEACRYSLMAGGKRVRPALTLEFCRLFGGTDEAALPFAAAVEMIHTFSLIHDDLPCMDDDDLRRGRPTNHKVFGEAVALLAGDGMALDAFRIAAGNTAVPADVRAQAAMLLSEAAGCAGMVRGQIMDMYGETHRLSLDELKLLQARKTGALIRVSAQLGVLAAGKSADGPEMAAAVSFAEKIGLAFQIVDDVLDVTATAEQMGKSVGSDAGHNKNTFLSFYTVEGALGEAARLTAEAVACIGDYPGSDRLCALAVYLAARDN
ncbi:MAG: polyprenyl synthetase family protein [Clostridia bacterium]|nr:polyprenyl synthetase family protein [Clostridia bacterium]